MEQATKIKRKPFKQLSNDIYADLHCTCPHKTIDGFTHTIKLVGYADANFFDNVNKEPQRRQCKCGREYTVQWFRDGVEAEFLDARN